MDGDFKSSHEREPQDPDTLLMSRFAAGDGRAFDELFQRNAARVYRMAFRFVGRPDDANDVVQEAFLRVLLARSTWTPRAKFSTWLYRIVVNLCLNELRRRKAISWVSLDAPVAEEAGEPPAPLPTADTCHAGHLLLKRERVAAVREAVQSLPADQRMAVVLHRYEGLSYKEIAQAMGRSVSSVESLLHRAKQTLREKLRPWVGD